MEIRRLIKCYLNNYYHTLLDLKKDDILSENVKFKDIHKSDRLIILGSGPSIKKQNLELLENEIVMTQNNFHVHESINIISPKYHCIIPHFHPASEDHKWIGWFQEMEERLPPDCVFFFGINSKSMVEKHTSLKDRSYYLKSKLDPLVMRSAHPDLTKSIMKIPTALTQCLNVAIYMGVSEIYLTGFDFDQMCYTDDKVGRFYGLSKITDSKSERRIHRARIDSGLAWFSRWLTYKQLRLLQDFACRYNIKIYNATCGGLLQGFERVEYDTLFAAHR